MMKRKIKLFVAIIAVMFLFSCVDKTNVDPAQASIDYLTALAEKDKTALINLSCTSWEEQASLEADSLLSVGASLNNVSCNVKGEEGVYSLVNCTGSLDLTYGEEIRSIDLSSRTYYLALEEGKWRVCAYK